MSKKAKAFIFVISAVSIALSFISINKLSLNHLSLYIPITILLCLSEIYPIPISDHNEINISFAIHFSGIVILGTYPALLFSAMASIITDIYNKRRLRAIAFNASQYALTIFITGGIYNFLKHTSYGINPVKDALAILCSAMVYFLCNTLFIAAIISLTTNRKFIDACLEDINMLFLYYFALTPIGVILCVVYFDYPVAVLYLIPPLVITDFAFRKYFDLRQQTRMTLETLADIIDERDAYTYEHSKRVAEYARQIAENMDLPTGDVDDIYTAGRVHDLGKISVPNEILNKKGKLTDDEYMNIKKHPYTAFKVLKNLRLYDKGTKYVLYHHERIDGTGYPEGIEGDKIPLGAKILAVADSYDAMVTDRPYRKGLHREKAMEELIKYKDKQFDSKVVDTFIEILKNEDKTE